jgi:hypothetical protein
VNGYVAVKNRNTRSQNAQNEDLTGCWSNEIKCKFCFPSAPVHICFCAYSVVAVGSSRLHIQIHTHKRTSVRAHTHARTHARTYTHTHTYTHIYHRVRGRGRSQRASQNSAVGPPRPLRALDENRQGLLQAPQRPLGPKRGDVGCILQ